jgi:hypothetical protein
MHRIYRPFFNVAAAVSFALAVASAQTTTGSIVGTLAIAAAPQWPTPV